MAATSSVHGVVGLYCLISPCYLEDLRKSRCLHACTDNLLRVDVSFNVLMKIHSFLKGHSQVRSREYVSTASLAPSKGEPHEQLGKPCTRDLPACHVLLAGCTGSQEEQGSQEESTVAAATTGEPTAASAADDATPQTVAATEGFLATLDDAQREQASFEFDSDLKK